MTPERKRPGEAATSSEPEFNQIPREDRKMNSPETTITLSGTPAPAGGEAMPRRSTPEYAEAWGRCRKLGKELSQALADTGDAEFGYILPAGYECAVSFGALQADMRREGEFPMQTINRLAGRIALILGDDPEITVKRVVIDAKGVHTQIKVPGAGDIPPVDPIIDAIRAFHDGNAAFCAIKEKDWPKHGGEESVIAKTYGPALDALADWEGPATTREGAMEALRLALKEWHEFSHSSCLTAMLAAAVAYFEGETV